MASNGIFPSIKSVAKALREYKPRDDEELDVRLQVGEDGVWSIRTGDSQYDQSHLGFWGCGYLNSKSNCYDVAKDLLEQVKEHHAQSQPVEPIKDSLHPHGL